LRKPKKITSYEEKISEDEKELAFQEEYKPKLKKKRETTRNFLYFNL